jgi:hypothetical protein
VSNLTSYILAGLPSLPSSITNLFNTSTAIIAVDQIATPFANDVWGVFNSNGQDAINADSLHAIAYRNEFDLSNYPQEQGAFASFNKVATPFDIRLRFLKGGSNSDRAAFLNNLDKVSKSLDLYTVVTPEVTYQNANILHIDYHREAREGATLLTVDVWLKEVRTVTGAISGGIGTTSVSTGILGGSLPSIPGVDGIIGSATDGIGSIAGLTGADTSSVGAIASVVAGQVQTFDPTTAVDAAIGDARSLLPDTLASLI